MKVKFDFEYLEDDAYARASSDLFCLELDCISILFASLTRINEALELSQFLEKQKFEWWGEEGRVVGDGDVARIYTPMSYNGEHAVIERKTLKKIVLDWIHFLETREPSEHQY